MVLPRSLREKYTKKAAFYNQTASKAEQIALCQFIRDGHLASQTRKLRRLYSQKLKALSQAVRETFGQDCQIQTGAAGTSLALTLPCSLTGSELTDRAGTMVWDWRFSEKTEPRSPWSSPAPPFHPRIFCLPVSF